MIPILIASPWVLLVTVVWLLVAAFLERCYEFVRGALLDT